VSRTYDAVLKGDHLEWKGSSPEAPKPVKVKVEVPDAPDESTPVLGSADYDFSGLSADERIKLAERLLESVRPEERVWTLSAAQRAELDRRLAEHDRDPDEGESWESVRAEIVADLASRKASAA
jgi:putative addiction module component (TIGR02574 family)